MKTWTKILLAVLSLVMVLSLAACGGDEPEETPAESKPVESPSDTQAPDTQTPDTQAPDTQAPDTQAPDTQAPDTQAPDTQAPDTQAPDTQAPDTQAPDTQAPDTSDTEPVVPPVEAPEFEDAVQGFVTGEIVDGKVIITNSANSTYPWAGTALEGYAIMSGNAGLDGSFSAFKFPITVTEDALLKFNLKVDAGEGAGDYVYILVNGFRYGLGDIYNGEHAVEVALAAGDHEITIAYRKDDVANADVTDAAYISKITVEKAPFQVAPIDLEMESAAPLAFDGAEQLQVEELAYVLNGASKSQVGDKGIIYIKKSHDYPRASLKFTVEEAGTYEFLVVIGGKDRTSAGACATGLVQVDNGQKYYLNSPCQQAEGTSEYFVGMTVELTAGEHDFHFYLAEDFNDASVKSIYFDYISFIKK